MSFLWDGTLTFTKNLNKYDAFCSPSLQEPFGLVIGEARINGLPVIATKTDGALEIFKENKKGKTEDHGGILVDISAPEQLAHAILRLLDAPFRKQMGTHATRNIQKTTALNACPMTYKHSLPKQK